MSGIRTPRPHRKNVKSLSNWDDLNRWASDLDLRVIEILRSLGDIARQLEKVTTSTTQTTITKHASQHLPSGTDALATAAPLSTLGGTSINSVGTANSFARSDHSHDLGTAAPAFVLGTSTSEGSSNNLSRVDAGIALFDTTVPANLAAAAATGSAAFAARRDHVHLFPPTLRSTANGSTLTLTDDAIDQTLTGSLGSLNIRPTAFTLSLPRWTAGGAGTSIVGTVLAFASLTSTLPGLTEGIRGTVTVDDSSNGSFYGSRLTCGPSGSASALSAANFTHLDFSMTGSVSLPGTQTVANRRYIDFGIPRLIGGTSVTVTDTGLMQSGAWQFVGVTAGAWTNAYIAKLGFPTVGGTVRRGFWLTTGSGNVGTEAANTEAFYAEALMRGTARRATYYADGMTTGTPTDVYAFFQGTAHVVGTNRYGARFTGATTGTPTLSVGVQVDAHAVGTTKRSFIGADPAQFGGVVLDDGTDVVVNTTIGTKIGTAITQKLGFWNAVPVVQQTVTGSRGGNVALASFLTALATAGLIVDSTTA